MFKIKENVNASNFSTLNVGGKFKYFTEIKDKKSLIKAYNFAKEKNVNLLILGGGSNTIFSDGLLNVFALKMNILGFKILNTNDKFVDIKIGAGENWDKIVKKTIEMKLSGFEALSAIPGTVGATPVQNVGAYGSEVKNNIISVDVFDLKKNTFSSLLNKDCKFGYRESIFKNEEKGRYIIIDVVYRLYKNKVIIPDYPIIKNHFMGRESVSLKDIRELIINIRSKKLPNFKEIPNVGSFFKNPIVDKSKVSSDMPSHKVVGGFKISAGWLIENAGLKGKSFGSVSVYKKNALILINNGQATQKDFIEARDEIIEIVKRKFDIILEQEPEMV